MHWDPVVSLGQPLPPKKPSKFANRGREWGGVETFWLNKEGAKGKLQFLLGGREVLSVFSVVAVPPLPVMQLEVFLELFNVLYYLGLAAACTATLYFLPIF